MDQLQDDWVAFLNHAPIHQGPSGVDGAAPAPSPIYVSTKTFILFLSGEALDLPTIFWGLPIIEYDVETVGITEKQMKFQCFSQEEVDAITTRLSDCGHTTTHVMHHTEGDGSFKDIRKVNIGLSRKALLSHKLKPKGAFYNCFVANVRVCVGGQFKEFHTKVFNTGKVEVPGIQTDEELSGVIQVLVGSVRPIAAVDHVRGSEQIVLINSNFNVNYYLRRDRLYASLRAKHGVSAVYDPCSYPGIQCTLYCRDGAVCTTPGGVKVAVMIFRTGSVLIVGKCAEPELHLVYEFLTTVFTEEYAEIRDANSAHAVKKKQKKKRYKEIVQLS